MVGDGPRSMSIVPYSSNRDVVLYFVLDRDSRQLVLRNANASNGDLDLDLMDCPYCHRPMRNRENGPDTHQGSSPAQPNFVNPEYFRLLHDSAPGSTSTSPPPSPRRRFPPPALTDGSVPENTYSQLPSSPQGISSAAFSQGYFKKFFIEEGELGYRKKDIMLLVKYILDEEKNFQTNVTGAAAMTQAFLPLLLKSSKPYLLYISSSIGSLTIFEKTHNFEYSSYAASKAALNMLTIAHHHQYKTQGAKVFAVCPGLVETNMRGTSEEARTYGGLAGKPEESARLLLSVLEGHRDLDAGKFIHKNGVYPW